MIVLGSIPAAVMASITLPLVPILPSSVAIIILSVYNLKSSTRKIIAVAALLLLISGAGCFNTTRSGSVSCAASLASSAVSTTAASTGPTPVISGVMRDRSCGPYSGSSAITNSTRRPASMSGQPVPRCALSVIRCPLRCCWRMETQHGAGGKGAASSGQAVADAGGLDGFGLGVQHGRLGGQRLRRHRRGEAQQQPPARQAAQAP